MPRVCDTCKSPYLLEVDEMVLAGWDVKEIQRVLKSKYPGNKLPSYDSLRNHARLHVEDVIDRGVESNTALKRQIRNEVKASILAATQLRKNLSIASEGLDQLWSEFIHTRDTRQLKQIGTLIGQVNKSIELLLKFQKEISQSQLTEDEVFERIMYCISEFPTEYVIKFKEKWEEFEHR